MTKLHQLYLWISLVACALLVTFVAVHLLSSSTSVAEAKAFTVQDCDRIKLGMTEREVEALLCRPADRQYHPWDIVVLLIPEPGTDPEWEKLWIDEKKNVLIVHFDAHGHVLAKALSSMNWE